MWPIMLYVKTDLQKMNDKMSDNRLVVDFLFDQEKDLRYFDDTIDTQVNDESDDARHERNQQSISFFLNRQVEGIRFEENDQWYK